MRGVHRLPLVLLVGCFVAGCRLPVRVPVAQLAVRTQVDVQVQATLVPAAVALDGAPVPEFFGIPLDDAQDVVFVLDTSGSMIQPAQGRIAQLQPPPPPADPAAPVPPQPAYAYSQRSKIAVAQDELISALERLPDGTRMNVLFFSTGVAGFAAGIVPLDEPRRANLIGFVKEQNPDSMTALAPAMRIALLMNPRRIVLLSDGRGNVGGSAAELLRDARAAIRGGVRIDTIGLGNDQDTELLATLARESGGIYQPL